MVLKYPEPDPGLQRVTPVGASRARSISEHLANMDHMARWPRVACARSSYPTGISDGAQTTFFQRLPLKFSAEADWTSIVFQFGGFREPDASGNSRDMDNPVTLKCALEVSANIILPLFINGERSYSIEPGEIVETAPCEARVAAGSTVWLRQYGTVSAAQVWPTGGLLIDSTPLGYQASPGADQVDAGALSIGVLNGATGHFPPLAVTGKPSDRFSMLTARSGQLVSSVGLIGDSIVVGSNGNADRVNQVRGFAQGAVDGMGRAFVLNAHSGRRLQQWGGDARQRFRQFNPFRHCQLVLCNLGTNDVGGGRSLLQMQADYLAIQAHLESMGLALVPLTVCPRTNAGNTALNGTQAMEDVRVSFNEWVREDPFGHGYFDMANSVESARNSGRWRTDLGAPTSDGIHPNDALHARAKADLIATLVELGM